MYKYFNKYTFVANSNKHAKKKKKKISNLSMQLWSYTKRPTAV